MPRSPGWWAYLVEGSRWGYYWRAVKDDPEAARSLGVRIFPSKMAAAAISGAITAIGGSLYAQYVGFIDPESTFGLPLSVLIALPAVVRRRRHPLGSAAGRRGADPRPSNSPSPGSARPAAASN